ncbi:MAG: hypothetical protein ACO3NK_06335 [Prochlorotrichaceae cyanobacterium]
MIFPANIGANASPLPIASLLLPIDRAILILNTEFMPSDQPFGE